LINSATNMYSCLIKILSNCFCFIQPRKDTIASTVGPVILHCIWKVVHLMNVCGCPYQIHLRRISHLNELWPTDDGSVSASCSRGFIVASSLHDRTAFVDGMKNYVHRQYILEVFLIPCCDFQEIVKCLTFTIWCFFMFCCVFLLELGLHTAGFLKHILRLITMIIFYLQSRYIKAKHCIW